MTAKAAVVTLLGCMMMSVVDSASTHLMRRMPKTTPKAIANMMPIESKHEDSTESGQSAMQLGAKPSAKVKSTSGQAASMWMTYHKKLVDPGCHPSDEFKQNLGKKGSVKECLEAVKASKLGNVGLWHRGTDQSCHVCNLHTRGRASTLKYKNSEDIDSLVQFSATTEFYTNNGATASTFQGAALINSGGFMLTPGEWAVKCNDLPANLKYITTTYGSKTDYFKPTDTSGSANFCSMLQKHDEHLFSTDGANWVLPDYASGTVNFCGGSSDDWPKNNVNSDDRSSLGTWCTELTGQGDNKGGYGSGTGDASWGQAFTMSYMEDYAECSVIDGTALSHTYPCACGNTDCSSGHQCDSSTSECTAAPAGATAAPTPAPASPTPASTNPSPTPSGGSTNPSPTPSAGSNSNSSSDSSSQNADTNPEDKISESNGANSTGKAIRNEGSSSDTAKLPPRSECADPAAHLLSTILAVVATCLALS